jgi:hypothetical protein
VERRLPRNLRSFVVFIASLALATAVAAQQMPDASQMAGQPLPAADLPQGTVSVRVVREQMGNNITGHPVTLRAGDRTLTATTDAQGRATFESIPVGTRATAETVVDGETLRSREFAIPTGAGIRIALIAGLQAAAAREQAAREEAAKQPARQGVVVFGGESRVIMEFQDDNLQVFYLLDIVNNARTPIDVGEPLYIVLPEGAIGAGALEGSSTQATVQGDRIRINGPFAPGLTSVQVGYRFPYSGDAAVLTQQWPAAFEQLFVAAEKVGNLQISSPQFQQQQDANAGGAPFIMATGGRLNAGDTLTITLSGLPHRSTTLRDVGIAAGVLILLGGLWAALSGPRVRRDQLQELTRRRDKLFADLVALEEQHRQHKIDERRYVSRRQALVTQLERVMGELDRGGGEGVAA